MNDRRLRALQFALNNKLENFDGYVALRLEGSSSNGDDPQRFSSIFAYLSFNRYSLRTPRDGGYSAF